jgi:hypothetical protein
MANFRHVIEIKINGASAGELEWVGEREQREVRLTFNHPKSGTSVGVVWKVDWERKTLAMNASQLVSAMNGTCLAGCLIGAGASLAKCLMNAKKEDDVWKCLDENAGVTGATVIGCVIACL